MTGPLGVGVLACEELSHVSGAGHVLSELRNQISLNLLHSVARSRRFVVDDPLNPPLRAADQQLGELVCWQTAVGQN